MCKLSVLTILCVVAAFVATNASKNCLCPQNLMYFPVCGSDGRTYVNPGSVECYNKCHRANVTIKEEQPCTCNCPTNRMYSPECANDGNSYVNPSAVRCHNKCNYPPIEKVRNGKCNEDDRVLNN